MNIPNNFKIGSSGINLIPVKPNGPRDKADLRELLSQFSARCVEAKNLMIEQFFPEMLDSDSYPSYILDSLAEGGYRAGFLLAMDGDEPFGRAEFAYADRDGEFNNAPLGEIYAPWLRGNTKLGLNTCISFAEVEVPKVVHIDVALRSILHSMRLSGSNTAPWLPLDGGPIEKLAQTEPSYGWYLAHLLLKENPSFAEQLGFDIFIGEPRSDWNLRSNGEAELWALRPAIAVPKVR